MCRPNTLCLPTNAWLHDPETAGKKENIRSYQCKDTIPTPGGKAGYADAPLWGYLGGRLECEVGGGGGHLTVMYFPLPYF